ncbi:MAG: Gfo/Idh/MocA family oxidoreductase [Clostridia bacterium]|nr:Gfo/Idh/MocA family oxidoreductase [Clostridia bacterium]
MGTLFNWNMILRVVLIKKLNAAIIGCGSIFKQHADAVAESSDAILVCVVDTDEVKAKKTAKTWGCSFHTDYSEMLKDRGIDVVHICTPHYLHAQMAVDALAAGKHVLTEKPMAITTEDAKRMIQASKTYGKSLGICFQNRYNLTSLRIKELLVSGRCGAVLGAKAYVTWHRDEKYYLDSGWRGTWSKEGGGVLINQAIHTLDLLQWFLGEVDCIKANTSTRKLANIIEVEDTADALIRFKSGIDAVFYATNCYPVNSPVFMEILCEKVVIRLDGELVITYKNGDRETIEDKNMITGEKSYWGMSHKKLIMDFYKCVLEQRPFPIDGEEGIKALKMVLDIYQAAHKTCH